METTNTEDPFVIIEEKSDEPEKEYKIYRDLQSGERWIIRKKCNQCGQCEVGAVGTESYLVWNPGKEVGEPEACKDLRFGTRKDLPMRPEAVNEDFDKCSLEGEYL